MKVDFPDPEGPSTTTISCSRTFREMSSSAWKSPNHLSTCSVMMMSSACAISSRTAGAGVVVSLLMVLLLFRSYRSPMPSEPSTRCEMRDMMNATTQKTTATNT